MEKSYRRKATGEKTGNTKKKKKKKKKKRKMASQTEEDLSCPICQNIFKDPVLLSCSHSFCKGCLQKWWSVKIINSCPVCKALSQQREPPINLALRNLCEAFLRDRDRGAPKRSEPLCGVHQKKLRLFCLEHQRPVCLICRDSKAHDKHTFRPCDEAAEEYRPAVRELLRSVREKMDLFEKVREDYDRTAGHIEFQAHHTERQIREEFENLRRLLQEEEDARVSALMDEVQQKAQEMKEKIQELTKGMASLSGTAGAVELQLRSADVPFLQNYAATVEAARRDLLLDAPPTAAGALVDVAKHLGNLSFGVWEKMKGWVSRSPVILDPNSAHPDLRLSEDLTSATRRERQKLPANPERIYSYPAVLGSAGYDSGTHSWDVEVGDSSLWALGVLAPSPQKNNNDPSKLLKVAFCDGEYTADSGVDPPGVLPITKRFHRIRVHLDCDKRRLSFSDAASETHIHTFKYNFSEKLFPYFNVVNAQPLKIMPAK
ncbi:unnamed protein product [Menidia menidia]|uniref:(Atlantic silverside) hypothetical protein n=1 Tax=Menidia menidia TaxID=238744 RepID=A0A8S4AKH1_9TELE|nr:unnamed protein product [Menidia menidia]CAG5866036.1 unnamed protein product [Menidia menidia]